MSCNVEKDADAVLTYGFNWAASDGTTNDGGADDDGWLQGDNITASTWSVTGPDALLIVEASAFSDTQTSVTLSGGTLNALYYVTNHITTNTTPTAHEDDRSIAVKVVDK